ncbi:MAG TPA: BON domain-containing protein [Bryobacteraceae bacterium]|jgi:osmotically-inducible protein OsmY|nr:BON domain-containing protein [Bryobacteraceae bacterium]
MSCSDRQQERAHEQADEARREAKKLGNEAKQEAHQLNRQINRALNSNESREAAQKLDRAALVAKVKAKLATDVGLSTVTSVDVDAAGRVVTLRGTVNSPEQKRQAEKAVAQLDGVTRVVNELQVAQ